MILFFLLICFSLAAAPVQKDSKHHPVIPRKKHVQPKRSPHKPKHLTAAEKNLKLPEEVAQAPHVTKEITVADVAKADKPEPKPKPKLPDNLFTIDRTEAVIYGEEVNEIVATSDLKGGFDGRAQTLEEVLFDRLVVQDALRHRILPDEKAIDDYMNKVARSFGGTVEDVHHMFEESGFTIEEGRRKFSEMYLIRQMQEHKVMSRLFIPEAEVKAYYEAHPETKPASYVLERTFIPLDHGKKDELVTELETYRLKGTLTVDGTKIDIHWQELPEINEPDLAEDKRFVIAFEPGQMSEPLLAEGGFELYRLRTKKPAFAVPLEDRYRDIVDVLRQPKFEKLMSDYRIELFDAASIVYF